MSDASGKTALLRATIVVVGNGGLRALTYRAVAAEAGVSHGLVRHHFGTRDQLLAEAMDLAIEESLKGSNMVDPSLGIDEFAQGIDTLAERESAVQAFQYELLLESRRRPELVPYVERHNQAYLDAIARQLANLGVQDDALARLVWYLLEGIVFKQLVVPEDVQTVLHRMRSLIRDAAAQAV